MLLLYNLNLNFIIKMIVLTIYFLIAGSVSFT